ncbi:MAG: TlpA disulfide reductase family protein [Phycisphaerae bacterium]|nr:TlpA disulfide reductase family protein [Phycisphaerae bacterium]
MEAEKANKNSFWSFLTIIIAVVAFAAVASHFFKNNSAFVGAAAPPVQIDEWITSPPPDLTGRVYVLEFWATWCGPCIQSIPHMIELVEKYKAVPFIAISIDRSSEPVKEMVKAKGMTYHIGMDNGLSDKYSVRGVPSAFIIDRDGQIAWQGHPMNPDFEHALIKAISAPSPQQ